MIETYGTTRLWTPYAEIEASAQRQIENMAQLPVLAGPIAIMPDVHYGIGATVGSVIPTRAAIVPASVGVDLGCGMAAVRLSLTADDLPDSLTEIRAQIERDIPVGFAMHDSRGYHKAVVESMQSGFDHILAQAPDLLDRRKAKEAWAFQIGTLGGGNHFIELCVDENMDVWVMLHSGSRGIGNAIGQYYIEKAKGYIESIGYGLADKDLAWLPEDSKLFRDYWTALLWAQEYAALNRRVMLDDILKGIRRYLPPFKMNGEVISCHHNYVSHEDGVYITRKGAIRAGKGELGIIPGSMGTKSYIVEGLGNAESYCSCSHGAGRRMSRGEAKRRYTVEDVAKQTAGVECRKDAGIIDEIPGAYKDIDVVMERQKDLVRPLHVLKQILCVKG
ncbi:MAG: RtcB family protein [Sulfobacillus sp.]